MADPRARIQRLLSLVPYVLKHQGATLGELCEVFGVTRDQLMRDLNLIFVCGQPDYTPADLIEVDIDGDRVFIRMADYFARPLRFTNTELYGLHLACSALAKLSGKEASTALLSAMEKISEALREGRPPQDGIDGRIEIKPPSHERDVLSELSRACGERRVVDMEYYTYGRDEMSRRRVHPLSLEFGMGHWYLRAWDERRGESRVFRVDRIKELEVTAETFVPPEGEDLESSPPGPYGAAESGGIEVKLSFSAALADWAREQPIFTRCEEVKGRLVCVLRTENLSWLERELLSYGTEVKVISPPELKRRLKERALATLAVYGTDRPDTS
ncbi:MAG: WYL domain-containing protein [Actinobacteria bacterium]|nr:WYL domain-containing protein [Actinomycetota bacterium]